MVWIQVVFSFNFRYSLFILFFILICLTMSTSNIPKYLLVPFLILSILPFWFYLDSVTCRFLLFVISMSIFSMPNPIPISSLYILTAFIRVSCCFEFFWKCLMLSMYIRWLIFLVIYEICIRLCISYVCNWIVSSVLLTVMVITRLPWRFLSGFLL